MNMIGLRQHNTRHAAAGFTLVELIIVIVLIGVVAAITAAFITRPIEGYVDLTRRAALVDSAESALRRMARDIRIALPNSVRVTNTGSGYALEMLPTLDGGRYDTDLDFSAADADFNIVGCFHNFTIPGTFSTTSHRLVINNLGTAVANENAYTSSGAQGVITPGGTTIEYSESPGPGCGGVNVHHINIGGGGYQFKQNSPLQRLFVIQTPVTYLCDETAQTLTRYWGYAITADQTTIDTDAELVGVGASTARIADHVNVCSATTTTGNVQQRGLVTLDLGLEDQGETIRLIHQVQLDNSR